MNLKNGLKKVNLRGVEIVGGLLLIAAFVLPAITLARHENKIYVDDSASGTQNGTEKHPYKTIKQAVDKADKNTEIHVSDGYYKENITIPEGVEIHGEDKDDVVIEAEDDDDPTIKMKDDTKIVDLLIKKGEVGVKVDDDADAEIIKCIIMDNDGDGVSVEKGDSEKDKITIVDSVIIKNGRSGIYSQRRNVVIADTHFADNEGDGIDIEDGSNVWIDSVKSKDNEKSGMKLGLDGSNITVKNSSFLENDREGIEVESHGVTGYLKIINSHVFENDRNGIARVLKNSSNYGAFGNFILEAVGFADNKIWNVTPIIKV